MFAIVGLILGIALGIYLEPTLPVGLQPYLPIAIVAALDALFGGFRAYLERVFDDKVFVVSFTSNVLIAALIVWVGDQIGVGAQLSTAVVVVLGIRIFTNAAGIPTYGTFESFIKPSDYFAHGLNEREPVASFYEGLQFWYLLLNDLAGSKKPK